MSSISSDLSQTTWAFNLDSPAPTTAELIADLQKIKDDLPGKYANDPCETLRLIAKKMKVCAASFLEVTAMTDPILFKFSPTRANLLYEKTCETPSRLVSKVKLKNQTDSSESDAIVIVNAQMIHVFSLDSRHLNFLHFQIKDWQIGGVSTEECIYLNAQKNFLEVDPVTAGFSSALLYTTDTTSLNKLHTVMQLFITHVTAANEFITKNGIETARFPSSRVELLNRMIELLRIGGFSSDVSKIVVSYVKDELVKPSTLGLPDDPDYAGLKEHEKLLSERGWTQHSLFR